MSDNDETSMYQDLIGFLQSNRQDLRLAAVQAVATAVKSSSGGEDNDDNAAAAAAKLIQCGAAAPLSKLTSQPGIIGVLALQNLTLLSSQGPSASQCVEDLVEAGTTSRMAEIGLSKHERDQETWVSWKKRVNYAMALLVNMTRTEKGAVDLVGRTLPEEAVVVVTKEEETTTHETNSDTEKLPSKPTLELLLSRFLSKDYLEDTTDTNPPKENDNDNHQDKDTDATTTLDADNRHDDPYQHFAAILMNATQLEAGRRFLLKIQRTPSPDTTSSVLQAILPQLRSPNPIRRRGTAGTLKNCCLERDAAWWLLEEVKLTNHLLYPLAGPEELDVDEKRGLDPDLWLEGPDKQRESDDWTRLYLVESILLLCATGRKSRERLRLSRVYVILKWADMVEEREDVSERINECVQFLRRDEHGTEEGSSDQSVQLAMGGETRLLALPASTASKEIGGIAEDYDDVD